MKTTVSFLAPACAFITIFFLSKYSKKIEFKLEKFTYFLRKVMDSTMKKVKRTETITGNVDARRNNETLVIPNWIVEIKDVNGNTSPTLYMVQEPNDTLTIGTAPESDIRINCQGALYISKLHALLQVNANQLVLKDQNSKNGVYNSKHERIDRISIYHNTVAFLGDLVKLHFRKVPASEFYSLLKSDRKIVIL